MLLSPEESKKNKRILQITVGTVIALVAALIVMVHYGSLYNAFVIAGFILAYSVTFVLLFFEKQQLAANYIILITTVLILTFIWTYAGLKDELLLVFPVLTAFAVLLGSMRVFTLVTIILFINIFALGWLNEIGYITHSPGQTNMYSAVNIAIIFALSSYTIIMLGRDLQQSVAELKNYRDKLEDKVKDRTVELESSIQQLHNTQDQLLEANKMAALGRLAAGISHELNTPVGVAMTAATHLKDEATSLQQLYDSNNMKRSDLEKYMSTLNDCSELLHSNLFRTTMLISDFKGATVIDHDIEQKTNCLKQLIGHSVLAENTALDEQLVEIKIDCDTKIEVVQDSKALSHILRQLLLNSCKHGFCGKHNNPIINISVKLDEERIQLHYSDNGKGLSDEVAAHIFEPFYTTDRTQGTGLGMHTVYNLITQSMAGTVKAIANSEGARFVLSFPVNK